jgi:hypothetical protein
MSFVAFSSLPTGLLVELGANASNALLAMMGAGAASVRVWAILTRQPQDRIKRLMAFGAAVGGGLLILFVLVDLILEGG